MKIHCVIWSLGVLMAVSAYECRAAFDGCDNFNDNSQDTNRWGTAIPAGVGLLTETNQRLEYSTGGAATGSDRDGQPWILNTGSYSNDWEVQVDFNMPNLNLTNGQSSVSFTLLVFPDTNLANRFEIHLNQRPVNSFEFEMDVQVNNATTTRATTNTLSTSAAGRIAFDATTKTLSASFDEDGANCGYSWKLLGAIPVPSAWNLTSNSVFNAVIGAGSRNIIVASSDHVFLDNFKAASSAFPALQIQRTGGGVAISWPTNAPNFHLESTATLSSPICWDVVANVPAVVSTNFTVTNTISGQTKFFRLSRYGSACQ